MIKTDYGRKYYKDNECSIYEQSGIAFDGKVVDLSVKELHTCSFNVKTGTESGNGGGIRTFFHLDTDCAMVNQQLTNSKGIHVATWGSLERDDLIECLQFALAVLREDRKNG